MLKDELAKLITGQILDDPDSLKKYSRDASIFEIHPQLVVFPKNSEEIKKLVRFVSSNQNQKLSLTCRAAGTDMTGGAINDSIIVDTANLNQIIEIGPDYAIVQPGILYRDFEAETLKHNLLMPIYPASKGICSVGGMVSTNAGGELNLTYGSLKNFVTELKVVLADGNEYTLTPLTKSQLDQKVKQPDLEGQIYSKISQLILQNQPLIDQSKPKVSKNSTGYFIWDVWQNDQFDLIKLFLGSQGTLGIITQIKFKLVQPKPHQALLLIKLSDLQQLDQIINKVLQYKPESFECFDDETYQLATKYFSELIKDFKLNNKLSATLSFMPEKLMALTHKFPKLVMLANFTGSTPAEAEATAAQAQSALSSLKLKASIINNPAAAEKYWIIRHKSFGLLMAHAQNSQASSFIDDIIVRPEFLPEFLPKLNQLLAPYKDRMHYTLAGHIGDGNFHIIPLMDLSRDEVRRIIPELMDKVFKLVFEYHGSMSAEHNDGLIRGPYLGIMFGNKMLEIFKEIKGIFDPESIFNPHKKTEASSDYSLKHLLHPTTSSI